MNVPAEPRACILYCPFGTPLLYADIRPLTPWSTSGGCLGTLCQGPCYTGTARNASKLWIHVLINKAFIRDTTYAISKTCLKTYKLDKVIKEK